MKMSKAAVKSDLLAHQDFSVGTSGGEECGGDRVDGGRYFGGKQEMNRNDSQEDKEKTRVKSQTPILRQ